MFTDEQVYRIVRGSIGPLYRLLTPDHDNGQPYKDALGLAGDKVEVTGTPMKKGGMNALVVTAVKKGA